jgi:transposase InsO family protein
LRRPLEFGQYTSYAFSQLLDDHRVLASIGSVGDAHDNALAESFVDSFKNELITDRVWRTTLAARARRRRVHRLAQQRPPARSTR